MKTWQGWEAGKSAMPHSSMQLFLLRTNQHPTHELRKRADVRVTIFSDTSIAVDGTTTGYYVDQAKSGTTLKEWHNNAHPRPRTLKSLTLRRIRYSFAKPEDYQAFAEEFLALWNDAA
jgi:hypothetical protein